MKDILRKWLADELSGMEDFLDTEKTPDATREEINKKESEWERSLELSSETKSVAKTVTRDFNVFYRIMAVVSCIVFAVVMLYVVAHLPEFGQANPAADEVANRYIEKGLEETGAVNVVAGMILDYRAFDTLGESFVLFTALICSTVLLRLDRKKKAEDGRIAGRDTYFDTSGDSILRSVGLFLFPCIMMFGIYVVLNGHISPGGGFSGGAILGAGLIILSSSLGFSKADTLLTYKRLNILSFIALGFYSLSKCYVFFIGANGIHNPIPKGIAGAIFSAGLILPLNIAVGLVVACTMYGFFSLFRRGGIGNG